MERNCFVLKAHVLSCALIFTTCERKVRTIREWESFGQSEAIQRQVHSESNEVSMSIHDISPGGLSFTFENTSNKKNIYTGQIMVIDSGVAPRAGAWIETPVDGP
jgi:hypothetical protein